MLTAADVVASHRDSMIWHAITRARERHGLHLTVSDIERLNAQYRTNKLTAVTSSSYETDTKKLHGYTRRILCWSLEYECYVAYDDTARTVTTFLPKGFDPDSPGQGSSVEAGPQRAKPLPLGEPHDWIGFAKQYMASRGLTINRGGWVRRNDGVLICHGYQQLIRNVRSNPGGEF